MYSGTYNRRPVKKLDMGKVLVYTKKDIDLDQLKKDIEEAIVPELDREKDYHREVYFVKDVKKNLPKKTKDKIEEEGWDDINAVFIRGTADPDTVRIPKMYTLKILKESLGKIEEKYEGKMKLAFRYADELKTGKIMNYNQNPVERERMT